MSDTPPALTLEGVVLIQFFTRGAQPILGGSQAASLCLGTKRSWGHWPYTWRSIYKALQMGLSLQSLTTCNLQLTKAYNLQSLTDGAQLTKPYKQLTKASPYKGSQMALNWLVIGVLQPRY
jgi:hypothetical protein